MRVGGSLIMVDLTFNDGCGGRDRWGERDVLGWLRGELASNDATT